MNNLIVDFSGENTMSSSDNVSSEISIEELWKQIKKQKVLFLSLPIIFGVITLFASSFITPLYESTATIRIGQVGKPAKNLDALAPKIESPSFTIARATDPGIIGKIQSKRNLSLEEQDMLKNNLRAFQQKGTDLVTIAVRAPKHEMALQLCKDASEAVIEEQNKLITPIIGKLNESLQKIEGQLSEEQSEIDFIKAKVNSWDKLSVKDIIRYTSYINGRQTNVRTTEEKKQFLEIQLNAPYTSESGLIWEPHVSQAPVYPNRILLFIQAMLIGFFFAFFIILLKSLRNIV